MPEKVSEFESRGSQIATSRGRDDRSKNLERRGICLDIKFNLTQEKDGNEPWRWRYLQRRSKHD